VHWILQKGCILLYLWGHAHVYTKLVSLGQILDPHPKAGHLNMTELPSGACIQVPFAWNWRGEKGDGSSLGLTQILDVIRVHAWPWSLTDPLGLLVVT